MQSYLLTFRQHLWLFIIPLLLTPVLVTLSFRPVPSYTGQTVLWVEQASTTELIKSIETIGYQSAAESQATLLQETLYSVSFLESISTAVRQAGFPLSKQQADQLQLHVLKTMKVRSEGSHLVFVQYQDIDERLTLFVTRFVIQSFYDTTTERVKTQGAGVVKQLESLTADAKTALDKAQEDLYAYMSLHPEAIKSHDTSALESLFPGNNLEYNLKVQTEANYRVRYEQLKSQLEQTQISYGNFVNGQQSAIVIRDQPTIIASNTFNNLSRTLIGLAYGITLGLLLTVLLLLLVTWTDRSLPFSQAIVRRRLGVNSVLILAPIKGLPRLTRKPGKGGVIYSRVYQRRRLLLVLTLGTLAALTLTGLFSLQAGRDPGLAIIFAGIALILTATARWPVLGYYLSVLIVLPCEVFANPDWISTYTILPLTNLNAFAGVPLSATPLEVLIAYTVIVSFIHVALANQPLLDRSLMSGTVAVLGGFVVFAYIYGVYIKHGDAKAAQWEFRALVYIIVLYFMTLHFMRDRTRWQTLSWVLLLGLSLMSGLTIFRFFAFQSISESGLYAESLNGFNHDTAILFVMLISWAIFKLIYSPSKLEKFFAGAILPPAFFCVMVSGRRAAFACLAGCIILMLISLFKHHRRIAITVAIILVLIVPPYTIIFRSAEGPLGSAARAFSSTSAEPGSRDYNSDLYRQIEKSNVQQTIKQSPWLGIGFGQEFTRYINFINLNGFVFQYFTPHIQVLWLWLKLGVGGWAVFWFMLCTALFKLGQIIKRNKPGNLLTMSLTAGSIIVSIMIFAYLDLSLINTRLMTLMGLAVGMLELTYRATQANQPTVALAESETQPKTTRVLELVDLK